MTNPTPRDSHFHKAGFLLDEAASHIAEAARLITMEAAHAEHLTRDPSRGDYTRSFPPPTSLSMQELTEMATKLSTVRNEVFMHGAWLNAEESNPS